MTKNKNYREFLDKGMMKTLSKDDLDILLENINGIYGKYIQEARALVILLYYTGARPGELLNMYQGDIYQEGRFCVANIPTLKKGIRRKIYLIMKRRHIKEMYDYCWNQFPKIILFPHYKGDHKRTYIDKKGMKREYLECSANFRYHFYKWSKDLLEGGITPYYLRHNQMTKLAEKGVSVYDLKYFKGAKRITSVEPYLHITGAMAKKIAKHTD